MLNLPFDLLRHDELMTMRTVPGESIVEIIDDVWLPLLRGSAADTQGTKCDTSHFNDGPTRASAHQV